MRGKWACTCTHVHRCALTMHTHACNRTQARLASAEADAGQLGGAREAEMEEQRQQLEQARRDMAAANAAATRVAEELQIERGARNNAEVCACVCTVCFMCEIECACMHTCRLQHANLPSSSYLLCV